MVTLLTFLTTMMGISIVLQAALLLNFKSRTKNLPGVNADEPVRLEAEPVLELSSHAKAILARDVNDLANDVLGGWDLNLVYQEKGGTIVFPLSEENIRSYEEKKADERPGVAKSSTRDKIFKALLERSLDPPKLLQRQPLQLLPRSEHRCCNCGWLEGDHE